MKSDRLAPLAIPVLLLLAQCSPVAPPTARGSAHFRTIKPTDAEPGTECTDSYGGIGNPPPEPPIVALGEADLHREGLVVDGQTAAGATSAYNITCKVSGNGDLAIAGTLEGPNTSPYLANKGSSTWIKIENGVIHPDGTGSAGISFFTTATLAVNPKEDTTCTLQAGPAPLKACSNSSCLSGEEPADAGTLALTFFCPDMNMGAAGIAADCEADGTVVLDRCTH